MDTFSVRDLREHTGSLIHEAEEGNLSLVTKHGRPVFLAVPFTNELVTFGLRTALAIKLFNEETVSLEKAAKIADLNLEVFIEKLGQLGISSVRYPAHELSQELEDLGRE
jgi:prevent-host-death family protein